MSWRAASAGVGFQSLRFLPGQTSSASMSTEQVTQKAKQTIRSVKEMLGKAEDSTHRALDRAAPAVVKSLDASLEAASKAFAKTTKTIDGATTDEQVKLFRAYKKLLEGQVGLLDARIMALEERAKPREPHQSTLQ